MAVAEPLLEEPDPLLAGTAERCLRWLRYGADGAALDFPIKIATYDGTVVAGGERLGAYVISLRSAQMYWAAAMLLPLYAETALAIRRSANEAIVAQWLCRTYPAEWESWRQRFPFKPAVKLRRHIADLMSQRLGEDPL